MIAAVGSIKNTLQPQYDATKNCAVRETAALSES